MTLLNQIEIEQRMVDNGISRNEYMLNAAEQAGSADRNPYAATIYRDYVEPLASLVQAAQNTTGPAARQAHATLLRTLDPWAVAYIAVRVALNNILAGTKESATTVRQLAYALGKAVHSELYLTQFDELAPDLFFIISEDLTRRKAKSAEHRVATFKAQAKAKGMVFMEWGVGNRDQVGAWLLEQMARLGFLVMDVPNPGPGKRHPLGVYLSAEVQDTIEHIKTSFALSRPMYGPCVEPPVDWTGWTQGGWHTNGMRRSLPHPVKARSSVREKLARHSMPTVLTCLNTLQRTAWKVNVPVLEAVQAVARMRNVGEIVMADPEDKPAPPEWFATIADGERTPQQEAEFKEWKAGMTAWYTRSKLQRAARARLTTALRVANDYRDYPAIYFVHFCDSRGRVYPMSQGLTPQGSDLQKALIHFAQGKPLNSHEAVQWFLIQGANKWGFDKAPLRERAAWHQERRELILAIADDPIENQDWLDADNPCQFLAWCFEYAQWTRDADFVSHLPVSLDGSCSGLQHFSAMLRDEIGGRATNLTPSPEMQDIYRMVADAAFTRLSAAPPDEAGYQQVWLAHGVNRSVTKRSVMTTPYGVTKRSATKYVIEDYLRVKPEFNPKQHYGLAHYLMEFVWPAIGDVVVKGREAMAYLEAGAKHILAEGKAPDGDITWLSPSGFLASQAYYETEEHNVATKLYGHARIKVLSESAEPSRQRHGQGMAPNFVHSMDAAHLHLTTTRMAQEIPGVSLAMIHDDFGTHAADTPVLYRALRDEFVRMYEGHDPLMALADRYDLPEPPSKGTLDIQEVRNSEFVFS